MDRRAFIRHLALLTAGAAALPAQVDAFARAFTLNAPPDVETGLIAVKDVFIGGMAIGSLPVAVDVYAGPSLALRFAINLYGGMVRWMGAPDCPLKLTTPAAFRWEIANPYGQVITPQDFAGSIRYVDQDGRWQCAAITRACGSLADEQPERLTQ